MRRLDQYVDTAIGTGQSYVGSAAWGDQLAGKSSQLGEDGKKRRLEHRAFTEIDKIVAEPFPVPNLSRLSRVTRPLQAEPRPPPRWRDYSKRPDNSAINADPFEGSKQSCELDRAVSVRIEVL
jgi:hypothetical protein